MAAPTAVAAWVVSYLYGGQAFSEATTDEPVPYQGAFVFFVLLFYIVPKLWWSLERAVFFPVPDVGIIAPFAAAVPPLGPAALFAQMLGNQEWAKGMWTIVLMGMALAAKHGLPSLFTKLYKML